MSENLNHSETFVILDLDRTLLDTEKLNDAYFDIVRGFNAHLADEMSQVKEQTEADGGSFDSHLFINSKLSPAQVADCDRRLVERLKQEAVINPGAAELLYKLDELGVHHGILTYGNPIWQRLKLEASRLDGLPFLITGDSHKGNLLRSWQTAGGEFHLPHELVVQELGMHAIFQSIILVDDKAVSFEDVPANVFGIWYKPTGEKLLRAQQGVVPANVVASPHLGHVLELIEQRIGTTETSVSS